MKIPDRNEKLIEFYLNGKSLRQTAYQFNISPQRVQQILIARQIPRHKYGIILDLERKIHV